MPLNGNGSVVSGGRIGGCEQLSEQRINLGRVPESLSSLSVSTNLTLVESETKILDAVGTGGELETRPLSGQSPYVYNVGMFYQNLDGTTSGSVLFNVFGRRLSAVGLQDTPDEYEQPRKTLDFTASQRIGNMKLKIAAENILNDESEYAQEIGGTNFISQLRENGRSLSLSLSYGS